MKSPKIALVSVAFGASLMLGCQTQAETETPDASDIATGIDVSRDALRARMDRSRINTAPLSAADLPKQEVLDLAAFKSALELHTNATFGADELAGGMTSMTLGTRVIELDANARYINMSDSRGYTFTAASDRTEAQLLTIATDLLERMGIDPSEARSKVVALGAASQDMTAPTLGGSGQSATGEQGNAGEIFVPGATSGAANGPVATRTERLGQKVFYFREIGGVPVAGHRMVFSFGLDGSLRHLRGTWPTIAYDRSQLNSTLTEDQVVERAIDTLLAAGFRVGGTETIRVSTFFDVQEAPDGTASIRLRGAAQAPSTGFDGNLGRGVIYEFDI